ncbi:MAG: hypothetical protein RLY87_2457 [Chloroflexota bacterium]|jgi:hypothetical protein
MEGLSVPVFCSRAKDTATELFIPKQNCIFRYEVDMVDLDYSVGVMLKYRYSVSVVNL